MRSLKHFAVISIFFLCGNTSTAETKSIPTLTNRGYANSDQLPETAKSRSGVTGTLNPGAFSAPILELTLADGTIIKARMQRVANDKEKGTQAWVGTFDDSPGSMFVLSKAKGVVTGFANYKDKTLQIVPTKNGKHILFEEDENKLPVLDAEDFETNGDVSSSTSSGTITTAAVTTVVHDVLLFYNAEAVTKVGSVAVLESKINAAVEGTIQAYANSNVVNFTLRIVGLQQAPSGVVTIDNLKSNSTVRALRDTLKADMVVMITGSGCGAANLMMLNGNTDAYAVVSTTCLAQHSLAHELGHLQGVDHNREDTTGVHFFDYAYGFRRCTTDGSGFRDIMSYACGTGMPSPRIAHFGNPAVFYNGFATGNSTTNAARALNDSAVQVSNYRIGTSTPPTVISPPKNLSVN